MKRITALLLLFSHLLSVQAEEIPKVLRFGIPSVGAGSPPRLPSGWLSLAQSRQAIEKEFVKEGMKVEWVFFKGAGPAVNEALANGQLDLSGHGDLPSAIGRSAGLDTRLILVYSSRTDVYVLARADRPEIKGIADLKGKRIAFHKGTATQLAANRILEDHGLAEKDVRVLNMESPAAMAAFQAGNLDAIFGAFTLLRLQEQGVGRVIYDSRARPKNTTQAYVLARLPFVEAHPETARRVVKALVGSAAWASKDENRDAVIKSWVSAGSISEAVFLKQYEGTPLGAVQSPLFDPFILGRIRQTRDDALKFKLIRKGYRTEDWVDTRYLDWALKELGLEGFWPTFDAEGRLIRPGTASKGVEGWASSRNIGALP